jgi:SET domain-containing protein
MDKTSELSFILKPSQHGVGVFTMHDIKKDTVMRLYGDSNPRRLLDKKDVPEFFRSFCADRGDKLICPPDFGYMPVGWYLNHSNVPNTEPRGGYQEDGYTFYAIRDIKSGEEITIDYNTLEEPEEAKEEYYLKK